MKSSKQIKQNIMRRVYYAFAIRLATHMTTVHLALLAVAVYAFTYFVHVAAIMKSAAVVPLGEFGPYMLRVVMHADGMTLVVLGVIIMTALSLPFSLPNYQRMVRERVLMS